jgi:hypothetical protein
MAAIKISFFPFEFSGFSRIFPLLPGKSNCLGHADIPWCARESITPTVSKYYFNPAEDQSELLRTVMDDSDN